MSHLLFDAEAVRELYDHAKASTFWEKKRFSSGRPFPCLCLVRGQGIYLISGGIPRLAEDPSFVNGKSKQVYAKGCDPNRDRDWWVAARSLAGGEGFVKFLPLESFDKIFATGSSTVTIELREQIVPLPSAVEAPEKPEPRRVPPTPTCCKPHRIKGLDL